MNTREFIKTLATRLGISQKEAEALLDQSTDTIREVIMEDKKLTIMHLGSFQLKKSGGKSTFIPAIQQKAVVPPKNSIHYLPAEGLKEKLKNIRPA